MGSHSLHSRTWSLDRDRRIHAFDILSLACLKELVVAINVHDLHLGREGRFDAKAVARFKEDNFSEMFLGLIDSCRRLRGSMVCRFQVEKAF